LVLIDGTDLDIESIVGWNDGYAKGVVGEGDTRNFEVCGADVGKDFVRAGAIDNFFNRPDDGLVRNEKGDEDEGKEEASTGVFVKEE
jgi:hypothetical protein